MVSPVLPPCYGLHVPFGARYLHQGGLALQQSVKSALVELHAAILLPARFTWVVPEVLPQEEFMPPTEH